MRTRTASAPAPAHETQVPRRSSRRRVVVAGLLAVVAAAGAGFLLLGDRGGTAPAGPTRLVVLAVRGGPRALVAVVGARGAVRPAAVILPAGLVLTVPGHGEAELEEAAALPPRTLRVAVANLLGVWVEHYAATDIDRLARAVDRAAGLPVTLPADPPAGGSQTSATLSGEQLRGFLAGEGREVDARWRIALGALLSEGVLASGDLLEADDPSAVSRLLEEAREARIRALPAEEVQPGFLVADLGAVSGVVQEAFGTVGEPVPVVVLNGSGTPGVGEQVAERLIPAGFQVVVSGNADDFGQAETLVTASGRESRTAAERAREALGVGRVGVSRVPSGLADVTIVVGADFEG